MALATIFTSKTARGPIFASQKKPDQVVEDLEANGMLNSAAYKQFYSGVFAVDCSISEDYDFSAEVTDNPVEKGINVSDNINVKPLKISMSLIQSDTPIFLEDLIGGIAVGAGAAIGQSVGPLGTIAGGVGAGALAKLMQNKATSGQVQQKTLSKTCYECFRNLLEQKAVLTIQTGLGIYKDMVIEGLRISRTPKDGRSLRFTVALRQIRIVQSQVREVRAPKRSRKVGDRANPTADKGRQSVKQNESFILQAGGLFGSLFQ